MLSLRRDDDFRKAAGGTGEDVRRLAGKISGALLRRGAPRDLAACDAEDLEQEAAVTIVEGVRLRSVPLSAEPYHVTAAGNQARVLVSRALVPCHVGERQVVKLARTLPPAAQINHFPTTRKRSTKANGIDLPGGPSPDARLLAAARARRQREVIAAVAWHVARMSRQDQAILGPLLGLRMMGGGEEFSDVAWRFGGFGPIRKAINRLKKRVLGDPAAKRARRAQLSA